MIWFVISTLTSIFTIEISFVYPPSHLEPVAGDNLAKSGLRRGVKPLLEVKGGPVTLSGGKTSTAPWRTVLLQLRPGRGGGVKWGNEKKKANAEH